MTTHRLISRTARRSAAVACALVAGAALGAAPAALAWDGSLQVRKVNLGGPQADTFGFKVETRAHGQQTWTLLPASDYTGAPWAAKPEPDNPFSLAGAPGPDGPFTRTGAAPTEALFTAIQTGGENAAPPPAMRDWRSVRVTETTAPEGYRTAVACTARNTASGAAWPASQDEYWGAWTATPTTAGGGAGVETTLRFLPDSVAAADRGPWTITCTFTNTYRSRVRVLKDFVAPINDAQRVDITVNGADVDTSAGGESFADGDASDWIAVDGGSDVALAEQGAAGTVITDYDSTLECRSGHRRDLRRLERRPGRDERDAHRRAARARLRVPLHEHRPHARRLRRDRDAAAERRLAARHDAVGHADRPRERTRPGHQRLHHLALRDRRRPRPRHRERHLPHQRQAPHAAHGGERRRHVPAAGPGVEPPARRQPGDGLRAVRRGDGRAAQAADPRVEPLPAPVGRPAAVHRLTALPSSAAGCASTASIPAT